MIQRHSLSYIPLKPRPRLHFFDHKCKEPCSCSAAHQLTQAVEGREPIRTSACIAIFGSQITTRKWDSLTQTTFLARIYQRYAARVIFIRLGYSIPIVCTILKFSTFSFRQGHNWLQQEMSKRLDLGFSPASQKMTRAIVVVYHGT